MIIEVSRLRAHVGCSLMRERSADDGFIADALPVMRRALGRRRKFPSSGPRVDARKVLRSASR